MPDIDAKQAIALAKAHLIELFSDESQTKPTLEEIWLEEAEPVWCITLGVRRPTNYVEKDGRGILYGGRTVPDYKVVRVSQKDGTIHSVKHREMVRG